MHLSWRERHFGRSRGPQSTLILALYRAYRVAFYIKSGLQYRLDAYETLCCTLYSEAGCPAHSPLFRNINVNLIYD